MRHWTNTKPGLAYPGLILASQFNGRSVYCVPEHQPSLVCSSILNYLQFKFFSIRSSKIASRFKEMQLLAFSHPAGSRQTLLENPTDHVTWGAVRLAGPLWWGVCAAEETSVVEKLVLELVLTVTSKCKPPHVKNLRKMKGTFLGRLMGAVAVCFPFPTWHPRQLTFGILNPGPTTGCLEPSSRFSRYLILRVWL